ncbi:hypothetical protein DHEL01_v206869 [Diaporthe helianthi]|uniref:Uncharacterized protein n=1 Tax=Diaporthe helianthi TaxID=158607 RepID=A0A2P5HWX0_DIAHE|nr:hypothetical protein DHEL01_v206869 [Diaporthe helianthi]
MGVHSVAEVGVGSGEQERGEGGPVVPVQYFLEPNRRKVGLRSDKMTEVRYRDWVRNQAALAGRTPNGVCVLTAGSSAVGIPCAPVLYAYSNGTEPARLQAHNKPDCARGREREWIHMYGNADHVGPKSADLPGEPRMKGAGGRQPKLGLQDPWILILSTTYHLPAELRLATPRPRGL